MPDSANDNEKPAAAPCPGCGKPMTARYRPFCSRHCADVDLARWLGGRYAIPAAPQDEDDEGESPPLQRDKDQS